MLHKITQAQGLYIAALAVPMGDLGREYLPEYKVFAHRPATYWSPGWLVMGSRPSRHPCPQMALRDAESRARAEIERLRFGIELARN